MISLMFLLTGELVIRIVTALLQLVSFVFPPQFIASVTGFVTQMGLLQYVFPVDTLLAALGVYLLFLGTLYSFQLTLWFLQMLPFIRIPQTLPHIDFGSGTLYDPQDYESFSGHRSGKYTSLRLREWYRKR